MKTIAILTGATGGLGRAFLNELIQEDLDEIWALARNEGKLQALCRTFGERVRPVLCDLGSEAEVLRLTTLLEREQPRVRFLINNAGLAKMGRAENFSPEEIARTVEVNCKTPALLMDLVLPYMGPGSRILNVASASAFQPNPYIALYSATKTFLRSYSRSLNYELKARQITCTAVCPGWIDTPMLRSEQNGKTVRFPGLVSPERVVRKALRDAKKGRDMSVCTLLVKYERLCSKLLPQRWSMALWGRAVRDYVKD